MAKRAALAGASPDEGLLDPAAAVEIVIEPAGLAHAGTTIGPATFDVLIDVSRDRLAPERLRALLAALGSGRCPAGRVTLCAASLPDPPPDGAIATIAGRRPGEILARAAQAAARARRHLLVLLAPIAIDAGTILQLAAALDQDPMFGTAQPRFADPTSERIWPLPAADDREVFQAQISRAALAPAPADVITPEFAACCLLLRWDLLIATQASNGAASTLTGELLYRLAAGRRIGFRNLVCNRVTLSTSLAYPEIYPIAPVTDIEALHQIDPHAAGAGKDLAALPQRRLESLIAAANPDQGRRRRLLLDCRGLSPLHNGTAVCILGVLDGFARQDTGWDVHVQATAASAAFHQLSKRFPQFVHIDHQHDPANDRFAMAVMLSQPWDLARICDLHRRALGLSFLMLDSIAWDIYPGYPEIGATWQIAARHADILFYISGYTRDRFRRRFPVAPGVTEAVTLLSLSPADYADVPLRETGSTDHILIFGNGLDHKHVGPTAQILADAFPSHRITALGVDAASGRNVTAIGSGQLTREKLLALVDRAGVIVFPSFYEGFGLPVVEGLARSVTVLVRRSALWEEIAAHTRLPGRLAVFDDPASLVDAVDRALKGLALPELPQGAALAPDAAPGGWTQTVQRISDVLADRLANLDIDHWQGRDQTLRLIDR